MIVDSLNTLSGSTDIEEIEKTLRAIHANVGYSIALPFHHSKALNASFAARDSKVKTGAVKCDLTCNFPYGLSSSLSSSLLYGFPVDLSFSLLERRHHLCASHNTLEEAPSCVHIPKHKILRAGTSESSKGCMSRVGVPLGSSLARSTRSQYWAH